MTLQKINMYKINFKQQCITVDNNLGQVEVKNLSITLDELQVHANLLKISGEYKCGDENSLAQWLGFLLLDCHMTLGHICDLSNYMYHGGDGFLDFLHVLMKLKYSENDMKTQEIRLYDFFPQKIVFIATGITKDCIFSLLDEEFDNSEAFKRLFFDDLDKGIHHLIESY